MIAVYAIIILFGTPQLQALVDAKQWDDAERQLMRLMPASRARFEGLIAHGRGQPAKAASAFERALRLTPKVPQLHLHAANAYLELKDFANALKHAEAASTLRQTALAQPLLEARALAGLGRDAEAFATLKQACELHPSTYRPWIEFAALANRKKLPLEVRRAAREVLKRTSAEDVRLAIFQLLIDDARALPILEKIVAEHPKSPEMRAHLGYAYAGHNHWFSAARLFEDAFHMTGRYAFEAADQYRMAGRYDDALRMNGLVPSGAPQESQRIAILFEQQKYAWIVAMNPSLESVSGRYRVAYAHYATGHLKEAKALARNLLKTSYNSEANAL